MKSTNRGASLRRTSLAALVALGSLVASAEAFAQDANPPPPGFAPAPPGYAPPPAGYAPYGYGDERELKKALRRWEPGEPIPVGYHVEEKPRMGLVIGGGVVFGTFWIFSLAGGVSAAHDNNDNKYLPLVAPVIGPFIAMGTLRTHDDNEGLVIFGLLLDGLAQAGGAAMLVGGLLNKRPKLVQNDARFTVMPAPMRVGSGQGFGLVGTF